MDRGKVKSSEDLKALPEGEWVDIPEGIPAEFVDDDAEPRFRPDFVRRVQKARRELARGKGVMLPDLPPAKAGRV